VLNNIPQQYPKKNGEFISKFPPSGRFVRNLYTEAANSDWNPWQLSDKERNKCEKQGVKCNAVFAQDHTFAVVANYKGISGTTALWDVATETGEIATAVLVPTTKTRDYACAAERWIQRTHSTPQAMYSDTWPAKDAFWITLVGEDQGRLGLFHFIRRITRTLRTNHFHFNKAINQLLEAIYSYHKPDYNKLLHHLKQGNFNGEKYSENDIAQMQATKKFRERYKSYLRKHINGPEHIRTELSKWFITFKCSSSEGQMPAEGQLDPRTGQTLFTETTHSAVDNCIQNAQHLQDRLPLEEMYREVKPPKNAKHECSTWISFRGESKLESFHDNVKHFGNTGMDPGLCDTLNLAGTARYNFTIRNRINKAEESDHDLPVQWQDVVSFFNHSELAFVNKMASDAKADDLPFTWVEELVEDTGEVFFSEYLMQRAKIKALHPNHQEDRCPCTHCKGQPTGPPHLPIQQSGQQITSRPARTNYTPVPCQRYLPSPSLPVPPPVMLPPLPPVTLPPPLQTSTTLAPPPMIATHWNSSLSIAYPQCHWPPVPWLAPPWANHCCRSKWDYDSSPRSFGRPHHDNDCTRPRHNQATSKIRRTSG
jgi:hypothetical protein